VTGDRRWNAAAAVIGLALVAGAIALLDGQRRARPDIVLVVLDTVRADHLPVYGYPRDTAPFLTGLAARGVVFDRAYAASSWTSPSVATLFTSVYPFQHGVVWGMKKMREAGYRFNHLPAELETIPEALRKAGYTTFAVSDNINVSPRTRFDAGFDRFESASDASSEAVNKRVKKWKADLEKAKPYFLYIQYMDAHAPYNPRGPWFDEFMKDPLAGHGERPEYVAAYDSEIRYLDDRLRGLYEALGWDRDTIVIVTADHGEEFWDRGMGGHAHTLQEELLRVPLIVIGGGFPPGRVEAPVGLVDVLPTLRALTGLPRDARNEGLSLASALEGRARGWAERTLFAHLVTFEEGAVHEAVLDGRFKLITTGGVSRLFDIVDDPREERDLSAERPDLVRRLRDRYQAFAGASRTYVELPTTQDLPPDAVEQLKALGYIK
jgi:arylsulfatase A-like enzyme